MPPSFAAPRAAPRAALLGAVALSGFAGLVWQLLWARQLALVLGGTVPAAAVVTAVFLAGLGVGARLAGGRADRLARPAWVYAACEVGVAGWGLALCSVLPWMATLGGDGATPDAHGWLVPSLGARLLDLASVALLLGPPTAMMGASLPLLAPEWVAGGSGGADRTAWRVGVLAAANTGGAALGALATDLVLVPAWGVRGAGAVGALAGVLAAGVALRWGGAPEGAVDERVERGAGPLRAASLALAMVGFAAMGFEIVWLRFLGSALGPYRAVFALLLGVLLVGWLAGALAAAAMTRRWAPVPLFIGAQGLVVALALGGMAMHDPRALLVEQLALAGSEVSVLARLGVNLWAVAGVVLPAAVAMGAAFPLAMATVHHAADGVGRSVGGLWVATTVGNAGGALVTGLVLLPRLGMQGASLLLACIAGLAPLALTRRPLAVVGLLPVLAFAWLPADQLLWASFPYGRAQEEGVLAVNEGLDATIVVTGRAEGPARLWTNGHPMSSTSPGAQRYMRLLAHVPLLAQESPRRVAVVCFGVGNTLHAVSLHRSVAQIDLADLSEGVLSMAPWFAHSNRSVLLDPRVLVHVEDGRRVLRGLAPGLDLVTLEPPPLAHAGVAALYSVEFYRIVASRLAQGGWLTQWLPAYQVPGPTVEALVAAFVEVFPDAVLLVGQGRELILAGVKGGTPQLDVAAVERRMAEPGVAEDLAGIGVADVRDVATLFAADGAHLRAVTAGTRPMDDDHPVAEASQVSHVALTELPADLFAPLAWTGFAPGLVDDPVVAERMRENAAEWATPAYRTYSTLPR